MNSTIRVVLADDHAIFRQGLAGLLGSVPEIELVGQAADANELLDLIDQQLPELAIADLSMPGPSSADVVKHILDNQLPTRLMILTMHNSADMARHVLDSGAVGYVLKKNAFDELRTAIDTVMRGKKFVSPSLPVKPFRGAGSPSQPLSPREVEIVRLVAAGHTNHRIARILEISNKTVQTHRARAMEKLAVHSAAELTYRATQMGLLG